MFLCQRRKLKEVLYFFSPFQSWQLCNLIVLCCWASKWPGMIFIFVSKESLYLGCLTVDTHELVASVWSNSIAPLPKILLQCYYLICYYWNRCVLVLEHLAIYPTKSSMYLSLFSSECVILPSLYFVSYVSRSRSHNGHISYKMGWTFSNI